MKVVLDTNVLVSAELSAGPPNRVVEEAVQGTFEIVVPEVVLGELKRVLIEKLRRPTAWQRSDVNLRELAIAIVPTPPHVEPVTSDPDDNEIIACAVEARADVIVSGDRRHMLPVGEHRGIRILTPQALLAELHAQAESRRR